MVLEHIGKIRMMNKVKIRMKRRKISTRLFQIVIVTVVLTLFIYLIFTAGFSPGQAPTVGVSSHFDPPPLPHPSITCRPRRSSAG